MTNHRVDVVIFALALAVFGLVVLALAWSGDWAYAGLARANGFRGTTFVSHGPGPSPGPGGDVVEGKEPLTLEELLEWHRLWARYVIGIDSGRPGLDPPRVYFGRHPFSDEEYAHMAEVRDVFRGAETAAVLALFVGVFRLWRARTRGTALRLLRDGGLVSAALVAAVGIAALLAFDPLFLLFHEVFFPRGNFLFDPATSNLIRLYPEWYWQGVTAGVGLSFIALALIAAGSAHLVLQSRSTTYTRAA